MSIIILDLGSGNTCKNNNEYIKMMIDKIKKNDTGKHEIILKFQLFTRESGGANLPLTEECFDYGFKYGISQGYEVTSSVFDMHSLDFLLNRYSEKIPFVKIANRRDLDWLMAYIPSNVKIVVSKTNDLFLPGIVNEIDQMWCISKYPAKYEDYKKLPIEIGDNISDHTEDFRLFREFSPNMVEWHFKLENSTGLDAGNFARTPDQLKEIL